MFDFISGTITEKFTDYFIVENNNMGFKVFASLNTLSELETGSKRKVYLNMVVREDDISLYGFSTIMERDVYRLLTTVKGVGPKVAIGILSGQDPKRLIIAIRNKDINTLTKLPGIGKKTAERIILELKEKTDFIECHEEVTTQVQEFVSNQVAEQTVEALIGLGYTKYEVEKTVYDKYREDISVEDLIRDVLREMIR